MKQYSSQIREAALRRILPPNSEPITSVARDMGISAQTLINWRKSAASEIPLELDSTKDSGQFSSEDKFEIVLATASMNETELGEYARNKGFLSNKSLCGALFVKKLTQILEMSANVSLLNSKKKMSKFNSLSRISTRRTALLPRWQRR